MSLKTLEIILWAIPSSILLGIIIWASIEFKKEQKPVIKTWVLEVIPTIIQVVIWGIVYIGALWGFIYLLGEATKQFGILGFVGVTVIVKLLTSTQNPPTK